MSIIHPSAIISPDAKIGRNVTIGPFAIVHGNVEIGEGCHIDSQCEIGYPTARAEGKPLRIGKNSLIRSHSVLYEGSTFGENLITGHRVTIREGTDAGNNFQVGTLSDIQGTCRIGNYVRFHSNVHIGQHSVIGDFVWVFPYVVLTNDPHPPSDIMEGVVLEDYVAVATMSVILPGVRVGTGALVGAHSLVNRNVDEDIVVAGNPAKNICGTDKIILKDGSQASAYPWRKHFHRGYPEDVVAKWINEFGNK